MRVVKHFLVWWCAGLLAVGTASAAARTQVKLLLSHEAARPGDTVLAGVRLQMPFLWHSYWRYAGDSGQSTAIEWTLPPGVTAGEILWPLPEVHADQAGDTEFTTYIYNNEVILFVPLTLGKSVPPGRVELQAEVSWQECEKVCVVGSMVVRAALTVGAESRPSADAATLESFRQKVPQAQTNLAVRAWWEPTDKPDARTLTLEWSSTNSAKSLDFFPYGTADYSIKSAAEKLDAGPGKLRLRKKVQKSGDAWPKKISGVLMENGPPVSAREVELNITEPETATAVNPPPPPKSLWAVLGFAFVGGLILNIMPCVLPVIALKIFSFVSQSRESPGRVRTLGLVYGLGVLASFAVLAGAAVAVQQAGGLASWGMALQNQMFRVVLVVLVTLVALNLFGVFEVTLSGGVMNVAGDLTAREGYAGAFFNGILATVLATPCTAPFLSVAVAFAFTQPPAITVLVFLTVGLGLAAPFVILCWQPAWLKLLPKPGAWMEKFKIAMGFPMLATAMWLFWFTAPRFGKSGVLWLGLFLVVLAAAMWVWGEFVQRGRSRRGLAMGIALLMLAGGYGFALERQLHWRKAAVVVTGGSLKETPDGIDWQPWSPEAVARARAEGRPVLVDFTADNCLNCQLNKLRSLEIPRTRAKLKEIGAVTLLGDFSDSDSRIAVELRRYQRPGVPLVLVYPKDPNAPPIVLPELFSPDEILQALAEAAR